MKQDFGEERKKITDTESVIFYDDFNILQFCCVINYFSYFQCIMLNQIIRGEKLLFSLSLKTA